MTLKDSGSKPRLVFVANSMYCNIVSGGDIHTCNLAAGSLRAGYQVHFLAGHALQGELARRGLAVSLSLTDRGVMAPRNFDSLGGQFALLSDYFGRMRGTLRRLDEIQPDDIVYSNCEFWWDSWPVLRCRARRKIMYIGMDCPTLKEILFQSRPDVKAVRLPSLHYWLSQHVSMQLFRRCPRKRLIYAHANQRARLMKLGYHEEDLVPVLNGVDIERPAAIPEQKKTFDVVWTGRVHQQKGIEDLVATLSFLKNRFNHFRALMIGNLKHSLGPLIAARPELDGAVEFSGYVSEEEKFRLLKCSRVFLMPSRYESWGIVIGEALASGLPVVAYDIEAYRPVFGDLLRYVRPFDAAEFQQAAAAEVQRCRGGAKPLNEELLSRFLRENSWPAVGERFLGAVRSLGG